MPQRAKAPIKNSKVNEAEIYLLFSLSFKNCFLSYLNQIIAIIIKKTPRKNFKTLSIVFRSMLLVLSLFGDFNFNYFRFPFNFFTSSTVRPVISEMVSTSMPFAFICRAISISRFRWAMAAASFL